MKIVSYNILSGGFSSFASEEAYPERMDLIRKAVQSFDADVVSLIETYRWEELFSQDDLKALFDYEQVYSITLDDPTLHAKGIDNGITVLSRVPQTEFEIVRIANRNIVKTTVVYKEKRMSLFSVYLDSEKESLRIRQLHALLKMVSDSVPTILMGDFNTFSGYDIPKVIAAGIDLATDTLQLDNLPTPALSKVRKSSVTDILGEHGFRDANLNKESTAPTDMVDKNLLDKFLRLDYIFFRGDIVVKNFQVLSGDLYEKASDHYPVAGTVE